MPFSQSFPLRPLCSLRRILTPNPRVPENSNISQEVSKPIKGYGKSQRGNCAGIVTGVCKNRNRAIGQLRLEGVNLRPSMLLPGGTLVAYSGLGQC